MSTRQVPGAIADTLPKLLLEAARTRGSDTALREKKLGVWSPITWAQYAENVQHTWSGLKALGVAEGERVFFIAENVPEVLYLDLAVQALGGMMGGAFPDSMGQEISHVWNHIGARIGVVGDQEQADKLLGLGLPRLERLIVIDDRGMDDYDDPRIITFAAMMKLGRELAPDVRKRFEAAVAAGDPSQPAALLYTSGTTGKPKGAVLTQMSAVHAGRAMMQAERLHPDDEIISYLPYAWVGERMYAQFYALAARYRVNFPEDADMDVVLGDWQELRPSIVVAPARIWELLCSRVYVGIDNTSRFKRWVFGLFMPLGYRVAEARFSGRPAGLATRLILPLADLVLFRPIRLRLGLNQARLAYTGGSGLGPEVFTFFHAIGVELRQIYGQTESSGISVFHQGPRIHADTVGEAMPGMELQISDGGEVLMRGPLVFSHYLDDFEATAATIKDGWLRTGDQGSLRDGQLMIVDRLKEVCRTSAGEEFSPQLLQNKLKFSRFIREAVVVGDRRPWVAALIQIDYENVGNWATRRSINYTTFANLSQRPEVRALIEEEIDRTNSSLPHGLRINTFHLLEKELDADDEEVTRTAKLRRANIERKYAQLIETLYVADRHLQLQEE